MATTSVFNMTSRASVGSVKEKTISRRPLRPEDKHIEQWIEMEHYRLQCAEAWPESDYKQAVLAAIESKLKTLETTSLAAVEQPHWMVCASTQPLVTLDLRTTKRSFSASRRLAA